MSDWFAQLVGFRERDAADIGALLTAEGDELVAPALNQRYKAGAFSTPSLAELRAQLQARTYDKGSARFSNIIGDAGALHGEFSGATFQVASQFNCLEFVGPSATPEDGVTGYAWDKTQGPCCAIACGAATVYRNYFGLHGRAQTASSQIENLRDVLHHFQPLEGRLNVKGGYTMADDVALKALTAKVAALDEAGRDEVKGLLRIGLQTDCQVTSRNWGRDQLRDPDFVVTQIFASACSVAYSRNGSGLWKAFASLILEASYEAAFLAAALNALDHPERPHADKLFLTAVGGGVFGNGLSWIARAIEKALASVDYPLDVRLVTYAPPVPRPFAQVAEVARALAASRKRPRDEGDAIGGAAASSPAAVRVARVAALQNAPAPEKPGPTLGGAAAAAPAAVRAARVAALEAPADATSDATTAAPPPPPGPSREL